MTTAAAVALVAAAVVAPVDWWSRAARRPAVEWVAKPLVTALVVVAALLLDPASSAMRAWFVAGFVLCLAGDVALMLPRERFVEGLGAFLLGHLAFVAGFWAGGFDALGAGAALVVVAVVALVVAGRPVLAGARRADRRLGGPVAAYLLVIAAMAAAAGFHGDAWGIAGAVAFLVSDALLGWNKFVRPVAWAPVAVMVTYHAALAGLLLSLPG